MPEEKKRRRRKAKSTDGAHNDMTSPSNTMRSQRSRQGRNPSNAKTYDTPPPTPPPRRASEGSQYDQKTTTVPIPCCGAWCVPTINPDPTFFRHFSNENTAPIDITRCFRWGERNKGCLLIGKCALAVSSGIRKFLMSIAVLLNTIIFVLLFFILMGASSSIDGVRDWHWFKGTTTVQNLGGFANPVTIVYYRSAFASVVDFENVNAEQITFIKEVPKIEDRDTGAVELKETGDKVTIGHWNRGFCVLGEFDGDQQCGYYADHMVAIFILGILACIYQITACLFNCQRLTEFGDYNFIKCYGGFQAIIGCLASFSTYLFCYQMVNSGLRGFGQRWKVLGGVEEQQAPDWILTIWVTLVLIAACVKLIDILFMCIVRSPAGRLDEVTYPENIQLPDYLLRFRDGNNPEQPYREIPSNIRRVVV